MVGDHGSTSSCLTNLQSCLGNREIKSLSTKQTPHPGKLKLCHTVFSVPSSSPPPTLTQPHPLGLTLFWPQKPAHLTYQASTGCGQRGHLGSGASEEPSWLALGPLEGVTDILPVCFSQGFGHEGWTLPTQRTQRQYAVSFCSLYSLPFSRQLAQLPPLSKPSLPSGQ